jgi:hypothetical protein
MQVFPYLDAALPTPAKWSEIIVGSDVKRAHQTFQVIKPVESILVPRIGPGKTKK